MRPGDVILRWNGQDVLGVGSFARRVASSPIGSTVRLTTFRDGQSLNISIAVAEHP
jgi:S1-C subfamily serine protease